MERRTIPTVLQPLSMPSQQETPIISATGSGETPVEKGHRESCKFCNAKAVFAPAKAARNKKQRKDIVFLLLLDARISC
jgi:hypothetical protein